LIGEDEASDDIAEFLDKEGFLLQSENWIDLLLEVL
jgi:hypothetical protein